MKNQMKSALSELDLQGKVVLDAATGAGESTYIWAEYICDNKLDTQIVSVDIDQPQEYIETLQQRLGEYSQCVEFVQGDIYNLDFIDTNSVDVVNCHDTIVFLNPTPLKLLSAIKEFHRVLKPGGTLIIVSELPVENTPEATGQWQRWNFAKGIWALNGETWSTEPGAEEVKNALELMGFTHFQQESLPGGRILKYHDCVQEWKDVVSQKIHELPWEALKPGLLKQVDGILDKVNSDGYLQCPNQYMIKCTKA